MNFLSPVFNYIAIISIFCFVIINSKVFPYSSLYIFLLALLIIFLHGINYIPHALVFSISLFFLYRSNYSISIINFFFVIIFLILFIFLNTNKSSDNIISSILSILFLLEYLHKKSVSKIHIFSVILIYFLTGNRSSLFLLICFFNNKFLFYCCLTSIPLFFFYSNYIFNSVTFIYDTFFTRYYTDGSVMHDTRINYAIEFFSNFNSILFGNYNGQTIPQTDNGTFNAHNSFLNIILRDKIIGLFKVMTWFSCIFVVPFNLFLGVTLRACFDSFLLGGFLELIVMSFIISTWLPKLRNISLLNKKIYTEA